MGSVKVDISMSLDGFVAAPDDTPEHGLGIGGEILHYWVFGGPGTYADFESDTPPEPMPGHPVDQAVMNESGNIGAAVAGRRMYDNAKGWGGNSPFGGPCFVVTHRFADQPDPASNLFFVSGVEDAVAQAQERAGDRDIALGGGASVIQQAVRAGLVDEIRVHVAPVLLGGGVSLFGALGTRLELEPITVRHSPYATHVDYRVVK
jgi:dihydrofolate reductase